MAATTTQVIKYIGRTNYFKGNTLWEIVGNLKNYGVGRVVVRSIFERYPEPSFLKILQVETLHYEPGEIRKVRVHCQKTFRGKSIPKKVTIESTSYKSDYRLLAKSEEADYCKVSNEKVLKEMPNEMEFPPLLKMMILEENANKGIIVDPDELKMKLKYGRGNNTNICHADESKKLPPLPIGLGTPACLELYKNIDLNV